MSETIIQPEIYKPKNIKSLAEGGVQQVRLGIQGYSKTGKTTAAVGFKKGEGFPNPFIVNFDRGAGAFSDREDILEIPFWDADWLKTIEPNFGIAAQAKITVKNVLEKWLIDELPKFKNNQTCVFDGGTALQQLYHAWYKLNPVVTQSGKVDDYGEYKLKIIFFGTVMTCFKSAKSHVVYLTHERESKRPDGSWDGKIRPLLSGQFENELASHFTDWFRQHSSAKLTDDKLTPEYLKSWKLTKDEFKKMQDSFSGDAIYYWQTQPDELFDGGTSTLVNQPKFIPARFADFKKYMKRPELFPS